MSSLATIILSLFLLASCAESTHQILREAGRLGIPPELEQQIDRSVAFADLQTAPADYVGRLVMFGGIVIRSKRTEVETEIEVLELPIQSAGPATEDRGRSQGRFLAVREEFLDPASVPPGTPISVIGLVKGSVTKSLDESEYSYPLIDLKHLVDWNNVPAQNYGSPFYDPYYSPYGYWGRPYGFYPYSYWGRPFPHSFAPSRPASPPPARQPTNIPPRFRRR